MAKNSNKKLKRMVIIIYVLVAIAAVALIATILLSNIKEKKWKEFKEQATAYEKLMEDSEIPLSYGDYGILLSHINDALRDGDDENIDEYMEKMEAYTPEIEELVTKRAQLIELQEKYLKAVENCSISADFADDHDNMVKELKKAVESIEIDKYADLKSRAESLMSDIVNANLKEIQLLKNEINNVDISNADSSDKITKTNLEIEIENLISEENYKEAYSKLQQLKIIVSEIERRASENSPENSGE